MTFSTYPTAGIAAFVTLMLVAGGLILALSGCEVGSPFRRPRMDQSLGVTSADHGESVVVAVTHAVLDGSQRAAFDASTRSVLNALPAHEGLVGYSVRTRLLGNEVWTMTIWRDDSCVDSFVSSVVHRDAMRAGMPAVISAQFHRFSWPARDVPPSWSEVKRRLAAEPTIEYRDPSTAP